MNHLMQGLAVMVAAIVVFIVIAQFVSWKTVATLMSNRKVQISLILGKLSSFMEYANQELNTELNCEMCREHRGDTLSVQGNNMSRYLSKGKRTFSTPTVITGTDTGSMLIKAVFLLIVGAIVIMTPLLIKVLYAPYKTTIVRIMSNHKRRILQIRGSLNSEMSMVITELSRKCLNTFRHVERLDGGYPITVQG